MQTEDFSPTQELQSPFEAIKQTDSLGREWWNSRKLARLLGYQKYWNFERIVDKVLSFLQQEKGLDLKEHIVEIEEMSQLYNGGYLPDRAEYDAFCGHSSDSCRNYSRPSRCRQTLYGSDDLEECPQRQSPVCGDISLLKWLNGKICWRTFQSDFDKFYKNLIELPCISYLNSQL